MKHILDFIEKLTKIRENIKDMNVWADYRDSKKLFFETHSCLQNDQNDIDKKFDLREIIKGFIKRLADANGIL